MAGQRRLFMTHAGELAHLLARSVAPGGMVSRFIRSYAERHKRHAILGNALQFREMESTIGREALLLMAVEAYRHMPRAFASGAKLRADEAAVAEVFAQEFLSSLRRIVAGPGKSHESSPESQGELAAFDRDLELYDRWTMRRSPLKALTVPPIGESPFPDRCAMLLDPSMMEEARREAADLESELAHNAARIFDHLGRTGLRPSPPRHAHQAPRRATKAAHPIQKNAPRKPPRRKKPFPKKRPRKISPRKNAAGKKSTAQRKAAHSNQPRSRKPPRARKR